MKYLANGINTKTEIVFIKKYRITVLFISADAVEQTGLRLLSIDDLDGHVIAFDIFRR